MMKNPKPPLDQSLAVRAGLPDEFRLILADYPRDGWQDHPDFNGLAAFWLDRHLNFRRMMQMLTTDAQARIDRALAPQDYARRLQRLGSGLLNELIGHHQIEDSAYFPELARLEPQISRGFDMLDADHHDLHDLIDRFATDANTVLGQADDALSRDATAVFLHGLGRFETMLARHLTDEEDLVLPVVLKHRVG